MPFAHKTRDVRRRNDLPVRSTPERHQFSEILVCPTEHRRVPSKTVLGFRQLRIARSSDRRHALQSEMPGERRPLIVRPSVSAPLPEACWQSVVADDRDRPVALKCTRAARDSRREHKRRRHIRSTALAESAHCVFKRERRITRLNIRILEVLPLTGCQPDLPEPIRTAPHSAGSCFGLDDQHQTLENDDQIDLTRSDGEVREHDSSARVGRKQPLDFLQRATFGFVLNRLADIDFDAICTGTAHTAVSPSFVGTRTAPP